MDAPQMNEICKSFIHVNARAKP